MREKCHWSPDSLLDLEGDSVRKQTNKQNLLTCSHDGCCSISHSNKWLVQKNPVNAFADIPPKITTQLQNISGPPWPGSHVSNGPNKSVN